MNRNRRQSQRRRNTDLTGPHHGAALENDVAGSGVLARRPHVIANISVDTYSDNRLIAAAASPIKLVGVLKRDNRVGALGHRRARHDAYRRSLTNWHVRQLARRHFAGHPQLDRTLARSAGDIRGPDGIPVHRRVGQRRDVKFGDEILRQNLPHRV